MAIAFGTRVAGGARHVLGGSGLPVPRRRTLTTPILGSVRSKMPALRHPCLRWPSTPALRARAPLPAPPRSALLASCSGRLVPQSARYPWTKPSMAFVHLADRWKRRGFPRSALLASCSGRLVPQSASCPWTKPSMAFVHLADRWKRRGFPRSALLASCSGRLVPQSARMRLSSIACRPPLSGSLPNGCLFVKPGLPRDWASRADPFTITGGLLSHAPRNSNACCPIRITCDCGACCLAGPPAHLRTASRLHARRAARRHRHHRRAAGALDARRAGGPGGGPARPVRE